MEYCGDCIHYIHTDEPFCDARPAGRNFAGYLNTACELFARGDSRKARSEYLARYNTIKFKTQQKKARAYDEALERAKKHNIDDAYASQGALIKSIFRELSESEDEGMRKRAIAILKQQRDYWSYDWPINKFPPAATRQDLVDAIDVALSYLEKQKENPKSADSIPSDCMSNVKCEDRWHKTANSLPDNGRDVLAKDALGNYLIASFDGAQWFVSVYDGEDHPVLHTPPIIEWCDIPSETCKESLHIQETCKENADSFISEDERIRKWCIEHFKECFRASKDNLEYRQYLNGKIIPWLEMQKEQKTADWSEEDEETIEKLHRLLVICRGEKKFIQEVDYNKMDNLLKSIRPSWKPSEEQMEALERASTNEYLSAKQFDILVSLYEQLKKLN